MITSPSMCGCSRASEGACLEWRALSFSRPPVMARTVTTLEIRRLSYLECQPSTPLKQWLRSESRPRANWCASSTNSRPPLHSLCPAPRVYDRCALQRKNNEAITSPQHFCPAVLYRLGIHPLCTQFEWRPTTSLAHKPSENHISHAHSREPRHSRHALARCSRSKTDQRESLSS